MEPTLTTLRPFVLALALLLSAGVCQAAVFKDEALQKLLEASRLDDLAREAKNKTGPDALAAQALAQMAANDKEALAASTKLAETCTQEHPQSASCHYALGSALGVQAQSGSVLAGLRLVGRIRTAFDKALELDPLMFEARSALQILYLVVPSMAGGSVDKAKQLESAVRDSQPEVAKLLRARLAFQDDRFDEVERELASIKLGEQRSFQNEVVNAWAGLTRRWLKDKQHAKARARFEQLAQQLPQLALPVYQLGRIAADEGKHEEAIRIYERARGLSGSAGLPIDYRVGVAHMDLGDKDKARQWLNRFSQDKRATPSNLEDARKRLKELG
jgi:tetratricopeptide (TPR) repeat protein